MSDLTGGGDRRATLDGFLDWYRGVAAKKLDGLTLEEATRVTTPSGVTLLGIVRHLAWAERLWFGHYFAGGAHELEDNTDSFKVRPGETVASVVAVYHEAWARSRATAADAPLEQLARVEHRVYGSVDLEWILMHLIEETARHAGHLDIPRELTDGRTGD